MGNFIRVEDFPGLPYIRDYFILEKVVSLCKPGLDIFESKWPATLKGARVGLLMHPASVNGRLDHAVDCFIKSEKIELKTLFGPQHGISGETQDNMVEWEGFKDQKRGFRFTASTGRRESQMPQC